MVSEERLYRLLGARLRELREGRDGRKQFTQAALASLVGLERTSITNIEKGSQKVPLHVLYRLCEVLKVDVSSVLPSLTEVQESERVLREVEVGAIEVKLPPLAAQAVEAIVGGANAGEPKK